MARLLFVSAVWIEFELDSLHNLIGSAAHSITEIAHKFRRLHVAEPLPRTVIDGDGIEANRVVP